MSLTLSNSFEIGKAAPAFSLVDVTTNSVHSLNDLKGQKGTAILFICNHCPFVIHINEALVKVANEYQKKGIAFIAISSNDVNNYPQDAPDKMKKHAQENAYAFPYLYDESQQVAKDYAAACTPDLYLFDADLNCTYHGQFDDSRPGNSIPVTGDSFTEAMDCLLLGKENSTAQKPSMGCGIKWK